VRIGNFSLLIPEGREAGSGHVNLRHGEVYTLRLGNHGPVACDAEVEVDGKPVGCFRVHARGSLLLERPSHDRGRFTFFRADSAEGAAAEAGTVSREDKGLVRVRFRPARQRARGSAEDGAWLAAGNYAKDGGTTADWGGDEEKTGGILSAGHTLKARSAGVTGLTGQSAQNFVTVGNLDYDPAGEVTITLRLVCGGEPAVRPLTACRGNPAPAPVD
jgi:hypothetical protein